MKETNWARYFSVWAAGWLMCLFSVAYLQGGFAQQNQEKKPEHKVAAELQVKILKARLTAQQVQSQAQYCQTTDFNAQFTTAAKQVSDASDEAFKAAGLDKKEWDLNFDTFEFTKKATPEPKKP